jgi:hypothetical protein
VHTQALVFACFNAYLCEQCDPACLAAGLISGGLRLRYALLHGHQQPSPASDFHRRHLHINLCARGVNVCVRVCV